MGLQRVTIMTWPSSLVAPWESEGRIIERKKEKEKERVKVSVFLTVY